MSGRKIAHTADIQIRKGVRHDEYREVFERFYKDLIKENPARIILAGDIFHNKVDMSPNLLKISAEFFKNLSKIAPVDIFPGNHDLNLTQLSQGDTIRSIIDIMDNGMVIEKDNPESISYHLTAMDGSNFIYYFPDTGYYQVDDDIVYGHYSCIDNGYLSLKEKEKSEGVKYIALYHGQVYESMNDNGTVNMDKTLIKTSAFNNFDMVIMGDIHEHQTFRDDESMAYCGSLIQQNYGESIEKGYLVWDIDTNSFRKKYIPNDFGFAKVNISRGEIWEDRLKNIKFSNDKKKTKVYVEWEEFEENYSIEKENQIIKFIKDKFGCKIVTVNHKEIFKDNTLNAEDDAAEDLIEENVNDLISKWIDDNDENFECDDDMKDSIIDLSKRIDTDLELDLQKAYSRVTWYVEDFEVCNLFSFGEKPIKVRLDKLMGLVGIFGRNYSGKSNTIKTLVWGLFQKVLNKGEVKELVNIYTDKDRGYVKIHIIIDGKRYRIFRSAKNKYDASGSVSKMEYVVDYLVETEDDSGKITWEKEINDKKTNTKSAVKELIEDAIGTFPDFCKVNLQAEKGENNYVNAGQQDKNEIFRRYTGLQPYSDRYDYAKKEFNEITKQQKSLGDINETQNKIKEVEDKLNSDKKNNEKLVNEKERITEKIKSSDEKILLLTGGVHKIEQLPENDVEVVNEKLTQFKSNLDSKENEASILDDWLSKNFKKELTEVITETYDDLTETLKSKRDRYKEEENSLSKCDKWIKKNTKKEEIDVSGHQGKIKKLIEEKINRENSLPSYRGENCPTCGKVSKEPNPQKEKVCLKEIGDYKSEIESLESDMSEAKKISDHNNLYDQAVSRLEIIKSQMSTLTSEGKEAKRKLDVLEKSKDAIEHNKVVDEKSTSLRAIRASIDDLKEKIGEYSQLTTKIAENEEKEAKNKSIKEKIDTEKSLVSDSKFSIQTIDRQMRDLAGEMRLGEKEIKDFNEKLDSIREAEKNYRKYSIYLQAVNRDGIPAQIIKRKLPAVNSKIRSILQGIVDYKIELYLHKGDIKEMMYYNDDKSDSLSLKSSSGSQGFLANLAIRDSLHYVSKLPKSSICIIDEGFGTLDKDTVIEMQGPLNYLKNKYRNVMVITHEDIIKDFMDHTISVSKTTDGISDEKMDKFPKAWVSSVDIT